jgi:large subunit ribosomal protein L24
MHVKTGDTVMLISGKERGMKGKVLRILAEESRVVVEGRNLVKRHQKPNPLIGRDGGIIEREAPIHSSNVLMFSEKAGRGVRTQSRYVGQDGSLFTTKSEAASSYENVPKRVPKVRYSPSTDERWE